MTTRDFVSGLLTPILVITATLSYAALIFSGPLKPGLAAGIGFGLVAAGVLAILFAVFSGLPFAIAGPDSKPVAVLAPFAAVLAADLARRGRASDATATVLFALIAGTIVTGAALYLLGVLKAGRWIRFVPYPVIAGFMAASGWMLASGGVRLAAGASSMTELFRQLAGGQHLMQIATTLAFAIGILLTRRIERPLAFPTLLAAETLATHAGLHAAGYSIGAARAQGWLLDLSGGAVLPDAWLLQSFRQVDLSAVLLRSGGYVALIAVTAMTLLMSVMAIELETRIDVDLDRELRLNGLANMLAGLGGGITGTISLSRTLFNYRTGARGRGSGIVAGAVCLLVLAFGTRALAFAPVPLLAALLLQLGGEMLAEWLVKGWRAMQRAEYLEMVVIFGVTVAWDFVAGVVLGFTAACITFAVNTSRRRLLKLGLNRTNYSGSVDRPVYQQEQLVRHGHTIQIMWLHGFVFFGSAHRLLEQIKVTVDAQSGACRSLILDFRQVMGIDSSAVMSLVKLLQIAQRRGFVLMLTEVPAHVESVLRTGGLFRNAGSGDCPIHIYPDTDGALEWCEDRLLAEIVTHEKSSRSVDDWLAVEIGGEEMLPRLVSYLELMEYKRGDFLIRQGDSSDGMYLLFAGRATVLYRTPEGVELRLRSMVGHTIVGEMGLYRALPRGASVRADQPTIAYRMSLESMTRMEHDDPELAYAFHRLVIRTLATRLDFANREVAGLRR